MALFSRIEGRPVELVSLSPLAADRGPGELKHIGYGVPLLAVYRAGEIERRVVFRTQSPNWFGHDRRADRADVALLAADTFIEQPRHVQVLDVGAMRDDDRFVSLARSGEFYLVTTYAEGSLYAGDLRRIEQSGVSTVLDVARAEALAHHLAAVHASGPTPPDPKRYERAVRDLVGSGEGIFGIADSYPSDCAITSAMLEKIEHACVAWRWRLRARAHRLRRTHGDFHPYNVLFRQGTDFTVLDASRGGAGDPADDLAAMSVNYLFAGLRHPHAWPRALRPLWSTFFTTYLDATKDEEVLEVFPPFFAWRALVLASPTWYPDVPNETRLALLGLAQRWLAGEPFNPRCVEEALPILPAPAG